MVHDEEQHVAALTEAEQAAAEQRSGGQVERPLRLLPGEPVERALLRLRILA